MPVGMPIPEPGSQLRRREPLKASKWETQPKRRRPIPKREEDRWETTSWIGRRWKGGNVWSRAVLKVEGLRPVLRGAGCSGVEKQVKRVCPRRGGEDGEAWVSW